MLALGLCIYQPRSQAGKSQRTLCDIVADLKKGEKKITKAIQELEAWDIKVAILAGEKPVKGVAALADLLTTKNEDVRLAVTFALGKIGTPAVAPLSKALASMDDSVRFYAVWSLGVIGPKAAGTIPAVIKAMAEDKSADVRRKAAFALGNLDPDGAMDEYSADQVLLPLAMAEEPSTFAVTAITSHLLTNAAVIRQFVEREIQIEGDEEGPGLMRIG
jgi:HEAT repeat protein